jgi:hypothetical protein
MSINKTFDLPSSGRGKICKVKSMMECESIPINESVKFK